MRLDRTPVYTNTLLAVLPTESRLMSAALLSVGWLRLACRKPCRLSFVKPDIILCKNDPFSSQYKEALRLKELAKYGWDFPFMSNQLWLTGHLKLPLPCQLKVSWHPLCFSAQRSNAFALSREGEASNEMENFCCSASFVFSCWFNYLFFAYLWFISKNISYW